MRSLPGSRQQNQELRGAELMGSKFERASAWAAHFVPLLTNSRSKHEFDLFGSVVYGLNIRSQHAIS